MLMDDKKKAVGVIIAGMKKPGITEKTDLEGIPEDKSIALESAADEILTAIETKNAKMLASALYSFDEIADSIHGEEEKAEGPEGEANEGY